MSDASTLIVIPTYNEREVLADIVGAVRKAVPAATVLIVDDNSPDGTGSLADQMAASDSQVERTRPSVWRPTRPIWPPTSRRSPRRAAGSGSSRWTPISPTTPTTFHGSCERWMKAPTSRSDRATPGAAEPRTGESEVRRPPRRTVEDVRQHRPRGRDAGLGAAGAHSSPQDRLIRAPRPAAPPVHLTARASSPTAAWRAPTRVCRPRSPWAPAKRIRAPADHSRLRPSTARVRPSG